MEDNQEDNQTLTNNGSISNNTYDYPNLDPFKVPHIKYIMNTCYILVFIACIVGNLLVILVVLVHQKMRTITNFFLANLAVADFLVGVFCVLPTMEFFSYPTWSMGRVMCKISSFVQATSYNASIAILTAISIERYFVIIHPIRTKQMTNLCLMRCVIIIIWIFAAVTGFPMIFFYDIRGTTNKVHFYCTVQFEMGSYIKPYVTVRFVFLYVLPLLLMSIIYVRISVVLWNKPDGLTQNTGAGNNEVYDSKAILKSGTGKQVSFSKAVIRLDDACDDTRSANAPNRPTSLHAATKKHDDVKGKNGRARHTGSQEDQRRGLDEDASDELLEANDHENDRRTDRHGLADCIRLKRMTTPTTPDSESAGSSRMSTSAVNKKTCRSESQMAKQQNALTARRRVVRMLIAVILAFALCLLPYHVKSVCLYWHRCTDINFTTMLFSGLVPLLKYVQCGLNPILYAFLSENFRKYFIEMMCCRHRKPAYQRSLKTTNSTL